MRTALLGLALALAACEDAPPPPPRRSSPRRPEFPSSSGLRNVRLDCFPAGFRAARIRLREERVELCGAAPAGPTLCYLINPATSEVVRAGVAEAPMAIPPTPVIESPLTRGELMVRGGRVSMRGGSLTTIGGRTQVAQARQLAFSSLENAVLVPWSDGWFVGVIGIRAPDLGASAFVDPSDGRAVGRSPVLPCDGGV